jgi:V/A-type H+/Na+-transporting ATPase subunit K
MIKIVIVVMATLIVVLPVVAYFMNQRTNNPLKSTKNLVAAFKAFNVLIALMVIGFVMVLFGAPDVALAAGLTQATKTVDAYASLAAGISAGLGSVGAGIAVSGTGAAAIGAVAEKPDFLGRSLIFVGLAEGIAIYGLLIAFLVLPK